MKKILLVEDREDEILLALRIIGKIRKDCLIEVARDGEDALTLIERELPGRFDLILLDIQLPGIDGFTVLRRIRENARLDGQTVVFLTTSSGAGDVSEAERLSADLFLTKPLGIKDFEVVMRGVIDRFL